jgi:arginine utilization protein RocB
VRNDLAARTRELALTLTSWPSVTGSHDEAAFAPKLAELLKPQGTAWCEPIHGDPAGRANVFAVKRGRSKRAIVLTGHFDVVPIDDYGELKHLALDAERLLPATIARLRATGENAMALADFESGDFLPGRGLLDMKAGLAAGIAAIESYSGDATLIFLGVSDEEDRSAGARAAIGRLKAFAQEQGLDIALVINLDAISDQGDGSLGRRVALGSIGKQLLTAFVAGKEAHACYPRDGVNAAYLAAELAAEFELAPELEEHTGEEIAAAPTALALKDLKHHPGAGLGLLEHVAAQALRRRGDGGGPRPRPPRYGPRRSENRPQRAGDELRRAQGARPAGRYDGNRGPRRSRFARTGEARHASRVAGFGAFRPCRGAGLRLHSLCGGCAH